MTNPTVTVPRVLLADLLSLDREKRIPAERHLYAILAKPEPCEFHGADAAACATYSGQQPCEPAAEVEVVARLQEQVEGLTLELWGCEGRLDTASRNAGAFEGRVGNLQVANGRLSDELVAARRTGGYWKDELIAANTLIDAMRAELDRANGLLRESYSELLAIKAEIGFRGATLALIGRIDNHLSEQQP